MHLFLFFVCLYCGQSRVAANYSFAECNQDKNVDVVSNQPTSVTCTGLRQGQNMYWSITKEGIETIIGNCSRCKNSSCPDCFVPNNNYLAIRQPTNTTLRLIDNVNTNNNSVLKCSNNGNRFFAVCNVIIIDAYKLPQCNDAVLQIHEKGKTMIECTGLHPLQTMYWSIMFNNGTEERLAECTNCNGMSECPACKVNNGDYNVTREATSSVLQLVGGDDSSKDGATLKCSKRDNATAAACKIRVSNETVGQDQNMPMLSAVGVGVGVGALVLVVVVVALVVILRRRGTSPNVDQTNHGTRAGKKVRHRELSVDNPAYSKGPDSILPIQSANIPPDSQTSWSTTGVDVSPDTEDHTYIEVDLDEEEEKKNSRNASGNKRRVHFCKNTPADKPPSSGELFSIDDDNYNNADVDFHALANTRPGSTRPDLSADADGYSHIAISSKSPHERVQGPDNNKLPEHDACVHPPRSKKPLSTADTPHHSDDYNHIAVNPKTTEEHRQWGTLQRQHGCSNPPNTKTALDKTTETAGHRDVYSHIAINSAVGEDVRRKSQTSAGEANVLDVDPYDRIQTPSHKDEPVLYENTLEKTAGECDDEFNRLKFSQLESKKTDDPEYSHISQV